MAFLQTTVKTVEPIIPELKPSMARAPRKPRKKDPVKQPGLRVGEDIERYVPAKHNK